MGWKDAWRRWFQRGAAGGASATGPTAGRGLPKSEAAAAANGSPSGEPAGLPECPVVEPADNPWGVRVVDVRPVTQHMLSTSRDPQVAANAVSFRAEDGLCFAGMSPMFDRTIDADLRYRADQPLLEGVLFNPVAMEQKWALYHHGGRLLCVRSWIRKVSVVATLELRDGEARISSIQGFLTDTGEPPEFTRRVLDFIVRTHVLGAACPTPLPPGFQNAPAEAALWCMSAFGSFAAFATDTPVDLPPPEAPLRVDSLLHIAAARGSPDDVARLLAAGWPIAPFARDGMCPLHWAVAAGSLEVMGVLTDHGCSPDVRSAQGVTPLMSAAQGGRTDAASALLDRGAEADAADLRGFTALHRAAEVGHEPIVRLLLERGASPFPEVAGHTPLSLARAGGHHAIVALLEERAH